jgi:hypothetical protein
MNQLDFENFGGFVHQAQIEGINMKRLYLASGLNWHEFGIALRDDTMTPDQKNAVASEITKWKKEIKQNNL